MRNQTLDHDSSNLFPWLGLRLSGARRCPYCNGHSINRESRRGLWQRAICAVMAVRPYRCNGCDRIHYARPGKSRDD